MSLAQFGGMARLLVAERNQMLRLLITTLAERAGHQIEAVESGEAVLERLQRGGFECLMIGSPLLLGGRSRPQTLLQHFEEDAVEVAPRIVVLTARTLDRELLVRAARLRVCAVISEPFDNDELLRIVDACARNERPPRRFVGFDDSALHHAFRGEVTLTDW